MPRSHNLSSATLKHIADSIAQRLSPNAISFMATGGQIELAESFETWFLGRSAISKPNSSIASVAQRTGYWHHQIRHGSRTTEFARSAPHGPEDSDWAVHAVMTSELATRIDAGVEQIDADASLHGSFVRLLVAPAYLLTALWLTMDDGTDRVLVVDVPQNYTHIDIGRIYAGPEFLRALGQEKHAQGIPPRLPQTSGPSSPQAS